MAQLSSTTIYGDLTVTGNTNIGLNITSAGDFTATGNIYGASIYLEEDANSSYYLRLYNNSGLTANKTLTINVNNGDREISLSGNLTTAGAFTTAGAYSITLTATNTTSVTLPTTGTLATLAGSEAFTNKTYNGYTLAAACAYGVTDSTSASAIGTGTSLPTERDIYYGLPTINNSHAYTSSSTYYAPTAGGAAGTILVGAGTTTAPTWTTLTIPSTIAASSILIAATANTLTALTSTTGLTNLQNNAGTITWAATTGTGNVVYSTSPSLTTPSLGVATATSINGLTITSSTGTLTITNAKTLSVSNSLTLTATDGSTLAIGAGGTLGSAAYTASTAYAPAAGSSSIVTVGTLTSGTWSATTIATNKGGTGLTSFTANGAVYATSTSALTTGTLPVASGGTGTTTQFTAGSVVFAGASGVYSEKNASLFWDNTNNRLGIGTASPSASLHISLSSAEYKFTSNSTSAYSTTINMDDSGLTIGHNSGARYVKFATSSTDRIYIHGDGKVGVGVTNTEQNSLMMLSGQILNYSQHGNTSEPYDQNLQLREHQMVGANQYNKGYSPGIGFHWGGRNSGSLIWYHNGEVQLINGSVTAYTPIRASAFNAESKRESKENITSFDYSGLEIVDKTNIVSFNYKNDDDRLLRVGFIAEETDSLLTGVDNDCMDTGNVIGVLLKAVQELSENNRNLAQRIAELESRV